MPKEFLPSGLLFEWYEPTLKFPVDIDIHQPVISHHGKTYLSFLSDDFLGFQTDVRIKHAALSSADALPMFQARRDAAESSELECSLSRFFRTEQSVLFDSSVTAVACLFAQLNPGASAVYFDSACNPVLAFGAQQTDVPVRVYPHRDMKALEELLQAGSKRAEFLRPIIVVESLYALTGSVAPLAALVELAERFQAFLVVDESFGIGILGGFGQGGLEAFSSHVDHIVLARFDSVLGSSGASLSGASAFCKRLHASALYQASPALLSFSVAAARQAFELLLHDNSTRGCLQARSVEVHQGLKSLGLSVVGEPGVPIIVFGIPSGKGKQKFLEAITERRVLLQNSRMSGEDSKSYFRLNLTVRHRQEHVQMLLQTLSDILSRLHS